LAVTTGADVPTVSGSALAVNSNKLIAEKMRSGSFMT
jgi:hypothetical protein